MIATARIETTRAALVQVRVRDEVSGKRVLGLGEAAALPPVTQEDQPGLLTALGEVAERCTGALLRDLSRRDLG